MFYLVRAAGSQKINIAGIKVEDCGNAEIFVNVDGSVLVNCGQKNCGLEFSSQNARCENCTLRINGTTKISKFI